MNPAEMTHRQVADLYRRLGEAHTACIRFALGVAAKMPDERRTDRDLFQDDLRAIATAAGFTAEHRALLAWWEKHGDEIERIVRASAAELGISLDRLDDVLNFYIEHRLDSVARGGRAH